MTPLDYEYLRKLQSRRLPRAHRCGLSLQNFYRLGMFDVIFCRNILIYFDQEAKIDILSRLVGAIARDGFLVLGAAETGVGLTDVFRTCREQRGLYRPNSDGACLAGTSVPGGPRQGWPPSRDCDDDRRW